MHHASDGHLEDAAGGPLTHAEAVRLAERYVGAYNDRDLDAMLAVQDENVLSYPAPLFGHRPHTGHAGVRAWWQAMVASDRWYEVVVNEVRQLEPNRFAILGAIHEEGEPLSPWGVLVRVRDGLIVESRSYLSEPELLANVRLLGAG
jgi:ketosteroid isomerase-like protein